MKYRIEADEWYPVYHFVESEYYDGNVNLTSSEKEEIDAAFIAFNKAQKLIKDRIGGIDE